MFFFFLLFFDSCLFFFFYFFLFCVIFLAVVNVYKSSLIIDFDKLKPIELDPYESITSAEMAAILEGKPNRAGELSEIDLKEIAERYRMQTIIFETAKRIYN